MTTSVLSQSHINVASCPDAIVFTEAIKILKHISAMTEFSRNYITTFNKLTVSVNQLCDESFAGNALTQSTFHALSDAYEHTVNLSKAYHEQSNITVYNKLTSFIKTKVHEARTHFDAMSASMDEALAKNASASRTKPGEAAEGRNALTAVVYCILAQNLFDM
uniref:Phasin_2 domain-containing protein n=1 Tax=Heterorhabditis bacteriophora TaxID=37862 RepID=A0A1I7WBS1_HETBA